MARPRFLAPRPLHRRLGRAGPSALTRLAVLLAALGAAVPAAARGSRGFLWQVEKDGRKGYLLGSVHMGDERLYPLSAATEQAWRTSKVLVVEADVSGSGMAALQGAAMEAMYQDGSTLADHIPKPLLERTLRALEGSALPKEMFLRFKPWLVAMQLTSLGFQKAGLDPKLGLDMHFLERAREEGRPVEELEGLAFQLALFSGFTDEEQVLFLEYTLEDIEHVASQVQTLMKAFKEGDEKILAKLSREALAKNPKLEPIFHKLYDTRNAKMAERVDSLIRAGKVPFVVVGAGHLVGREGLLELLEKKGYTVTRL